MNLIERVKNILLTPKTEWEVIKNESATPASMLTSYVLPLAVIPAATALLTGLMWSSMKYGLISAVIAFVTAAISLFVCAYVTDALAPSFSSEKNLNKSAQLIGYSYTASAVASVLGFIPGINIGAALAGFAYSVYLMFLGVGPLKNTPEDKKIGYVLVIILIQIVIYFIISSIILGAVYRSMAGNVVIVN